MWAFSLRSFHDQMSRDTIVLVTALPALCNSFIPNELPMLTTGVSRDLVATVRTSLLISCTNTFHVARPSKDGSLPHSENSLDRCPKREIPGF